MKRRHFRATLAALLTILAASGASYAQDNFPSHRIRIVIRYSAGSVADVFARIVAQNMAAQWNGAIVNEIKSGANGSIAAEDDSPSPPSRYPRHFVTRHFPTTPS